VKPHLRTLLVPGKTFELPRLNNFQPIQGILYHWGLDRSTFKNLSKINRSSILWTLKKAAKFGRVPKDLPPASHP
ncbi:MAG TPA: hypothetical protein VKA34_22385, partial [Balneolales bacterium]|nr:hypothetical protein [Balneolales bacterium]